VIGEIASQSLGEAEREGRSRFYNRTPLHAFARAVEYTPTSLGGPVSAPIRTLEEALDDDLFAALLDLADGDRAMPLAKLALIVALTVALCGTYLLVLTLGDPDQLPTSCGYGIRSGTATYGGGCAPRRGLQPNSLGR
jgi:hypothetical protein